jgi:hypothetical protein
MYCDSTMGPALTLESPIYSINKFGADIKKKRPCTGLVPYVIYTVNKFRVSAI